VVKKYQDKKGNFLDSKVSKLIDKWITCSLTTYKGKDKKLNDLVKEVNVHKHTKSCQKGKNPCRFSFPRLPSNKTLISNPLSEEELRKEIYNLIYIPLPKDQLSKEVYKEKIDEAKDILQTVKNKMSEITENKLEKYSLELPKRYTRKSLIRQKIFLK
jgi:hypothetical protein